MTKIGPGAVEAIGEKSWEGRSIMKKGRASSPARGFFREADSVLASLPPPTHKAQTASKMRWPEGIRCYFFIKVKS